MKFLHVLTVWLFLVVTGLAQEPEPIIYKVIMPIEVTQEAVTIPEELKDKQWNRWTSENFTVLAINNHQAKFLHGHLELLKSWLYNRWGFGDHSFSSDCMIMCVDDPVLYEKMFRIQKTRVEIRRDESGKIKSSIIFLLANEPPSEVLPDPLTEVCWAELTQKYNTEWGWWAYRGMGSVNSSVKKIKESVGKLELFIQTDQPLYFSQSLLQMTKDQYFQLSDNNRQLFDQCAIAFCLLLRKEYGENKMHWFLKNSVENGPEIAIKETLGFKDGYDEFDRTFKRYMIDLSREINLKNTPNHYLQIEPVN